MYHAGQLQDSNCPTVWFTPRIDLLRSGRPPTGSKKLQDQNTNGKKLDISKNRGERSWSRYELFMRVVWASVCPFFFLSPRPFWGWRRWLLRCLGAEIGDNAHVYPTARITMPWNLQLGEECAIGDRAILYALGPITVGRRATISQGAHLCAGTHDLSKPHRPLVKSSIEIGDDSWVAADAFVGPGVCVGDGAVVGARAVVVNDVAPGCVVAGNPARLLRKLHT